MQRRLGNVVCTQAEEASFPTGKAGCSVVCCWWLLPGERADSVHLLPAPYPVTSTTVGTFTPQKSANITDQGFFFSRGQFTSTPLAESLSHPSIFLPTPLYYLVSHYIWLLHILESGLPSPSIPRYPSLDLDSSSCD